MCRMTRGACAFLLLCFTILSSSAARAADWYVSTTGAAANSGAIDSPWDIESALDGRHAVAPGDTIWVRGGTYKAPWPSPIDPLGYGFLVKLTGAAGAPIHVRPHTGEHVTIDGGLYVQSPSSHLWIWDFEILVSEPRRVYGPTEVLDRPWGGVSVLYGTGLKFINLVLHDNCMGFGFWTPAIDSEIYGCLIYNNGYMLSDGTGMGPGIYTQNGEGGYKYITDNIIAGNYLTTGFKAYSSKAYVNNFFIDGNICYEQKQFLVGGEGPSKNIVARNNALYGPAMDIGYKYYYGYNENCTVTDNVVGNNWLSITRYQSVVSSGNQVVPSFFPRPKAASYKFRPNLYDPKRAHLAIFNWRRQSAVTVKPGTFLKSGESYRLMDPKKIYGAPVHSGVYNGFSINVPMTGEFAAFVIMK